MNTYSSYLSETPNAIILDVAGGKGDLAWLLTNVDGFSAVVLDPRKTMHDHIVKSIAYLRSHPDEALVRSIQNRQTYQPLASLLPRLETKELGDLKSPRHLRLYCDKDLVKAVVESEDDEVETSAWNKCLAKVSKVPLCGNVTLQQQHQLQQNEEIDDMKLSLQIIRASRLLVGFHPDQATEPIIDMALHLNIPFCVVPCCVFPSEFPDRKCVFVGAGSNDGEIEKEVEEGHETRRVKTYNEFIDYLMAKNKRIKKAALSFEQMGEGGHSGRNIILYTT